MSSSEPGAETGCFTLERVPPDDGRRESLWVALAMLLVLGAGAAGIWLRQEAAEPPAAHLSLNREQTQWLTELSIGAEEIRFMAPAGGPWPEPAALAALAVPPFDRPEYRWQQPAADCYQAVDPANLGDFALWLAPEGGIFFHAGDSHPLTGCHELTSWTRMDNQP